MEKQMIDLPFGGEIPADELTDHPSAAEPRNLPLYVTDPETGDKMMRQGEGPDYYYVVCEDAETKAPTIGHWGLSRKRFLKEQQPAVFKEMEENGTLTAHLLETDQTASQMFDDLIQKMKAKEPTLTEELKAKDMLKWAGLMNNIQASARAVVTREVITR